MTTTWTMPRDMSRFSALEAAMLQDIHAAGLPEPVAEHPFDKCCPHPKKDHRPAERPRPPRHWYHAPPMPARCDGCHLGAHLHEYRKGRNWRFDFAWPRYMLAVECEGGTWSGGRHTRGAGFAADAEKYNAAALAGWTVLRFTGAQVESGEAIEMIEAALRPRMEMHS